MKTILVPTDFSPAAGNAAVYAIDFAKKINADVLLYHVYHVQISKSTAEIIAKSPEELKKENEGYLIKEVERLRTKTGTEIKYKAQMGLAVDEILEEQNNANLIIMGMKGVSKLTEMIMGSITTAVMRKAEIPVLIIPENAKYQNPEKIVFATDYDPRTNIQTLDTLKELMKTFNSK